MNPRPRDWRHYGAAANRSMPAEQVIDERVADTAGGILGSADGRFFGWVIGGSLPAALAADWLKDLLGLPGHASFALTSGCQMAHVTALAATRALPA